MTNVFKMLFSIKAIAATLFTSSTFMHTCDVDVILTISEGKLVNVQNELSPFVDRILIGFLFE